MAQGDFKLKRKKANNPFKAKAKQLKIKSKTLKKGVWNLPPKKGQQQQIKHKVEEHLRKSINKNIEHELKELAAKEGAPFKALKPSSSQAKDT